MPAGRYATRGGRVRRQAKRRRRRIGRQASVSPTISWVAPGGSEPSLLARAAWPLATKPRTNDAEVSQGGGQLDGRKTDDKVEDEEVLRRAPPSMPRAAHWLEVAVEFLAARRAFAGLAGTAGVN